MVEVKYGIKLSRLTNIYALFFMQALLFAKEGARIAFITPSEFLYTGYGEELKSFFLKYTTLDALILIDFEALVFDTALTTAVITLFRKGAPQPGHKVRFIRVFEWPPTVEMLRAVTIGAENPKKYVIRQIFQKELNPRQKWLEYFESVNHESMLKKLVPLCKFADIDRGIATGYNDYFTLSESQMKHWGIEKRFFVPVISKTIQCRGYDFTAEDWHHLKASDEKVFLLYVFDEPSPNLRKYIEYGQQLKVHQRYLTRYRNPWYSMEKREPAPILATVFHRRRMRFVLNSANVRNLTAFHCVYPKFTDQVMIKALLAYLNSDLCKELQIIKRREYGGGLHKFEPRDLESIPTLDLSRLSKDNLEFLASMFDKLCSSFRKGEDETRIKKELDSFLRSLIAMM
jgi:adenine-specific DNA-methyltransferase